MLRYAGSKHEPDPRGVTRSLRLQWRVSGSGEIAASLPSSTYCCVVICASICLQIALFCMQSRKQPSNSATCANEHKQHYNNTVKLRNFTDNKWPILGAATYPFLIILTSMDSPQWENKNYYVNLSFIAVGLVRIKKNVSNYNSNRPFLSIILTNMCHSLL